VIVLLSGVGPVAGFREDEVQCEEALAHLLECCDEFTSNLECYFSDPGCDPPTYPDLDVAESRHVQSLSCSQIRATDYCSFTYVDPDTYEDSESL
jgi:hypothetical protein